MTQINTTCPICHQFIKPELRKAVGDNTHSLASCCGMFIHSVWSFKKIGNRVVGHKETHKDVMKWGERIPAGEILKEIKLKDKKKIGVWFIHNYLKGKEKAVRKWRVGEDLDFFEGIVGTSLRFLKKKQLVSKYITGGWGRPRIIYWGIK